MLTDRKLIQGKLHDIEMSIRGILRGFGLKVGPTTRRTSAGRIRVLIAGHSTLEAVESSDLKGWALAVARRAGPRKPRVALARKLAVLSHRMLSDRTNFIAHKVAPAQAA
ncbi:hypothetical protein [Sinorhizobium sp. 8-89]|uniref:hypothetical protein n=1 Tax=Sinorhizobium sp. 8-89 TaxID=3049089 RepID=UPI0038644E21